MDQKTPHVVWHQQSIGRPERQALLAQKGCVVWFTGLSGSGKSTLANALESLLFSTGKKTFLLDGDNIRHGLCATPQILQPLYGEDFAQRFGLGFASEDRQENIRRVGAVSQLLVEAGLIVLTAFVSPYRNDRDRVRQWVCERGTATDFIEIFVDTPLDVCEQRDPKGLYKLARAGKISHFTGITDPYEPPINPEIHLDGRQPIDQLAQIVYQALKERNKLTD
ncbi:MAG: Adenylyl-sulfate kinase [Planctomycetota bacterium]|jgi:adenylylsulfate kinase